MMEIKKSTGTYSGFCSQFNEEPFAFEAELANLGPVEGIDFCVPLNTRCAEDFQKQTVESIYIAFPQRLTASSHSK